MDVEVEAARRVYSLRLGVAVGRDGAAGDLQEGVEVVLDELGAAAPVLAGVVEHGRAGVVPAGRRRVLGDFVLLLAAKVDAASLAVRAGRSGANMA